MAAQSKIGNRKSAIYTAALAEGYEAVMAHVDYRRWAGYAHDLLQEHAPAAWTLGPKRLLELGCGTGTLARVLQPLGPYRYLATDRSEAMLAVARRKARAESLPIRFRKMDFTQIDAERSFDAVLLLYDGLNYLLEEPQVQRVFSGVARVLRPGGLFLFDQSTPANTADPAVFEDEGTFEDADGRRVRYRRESRFDAERYLHVTRFRFDGPAGAQVERHLQRPYGVEAIRRLLRASPLTPRAAYDGFTTDPPTEESRRVHWVAQFCG